MSSSQSRHIRTCMIGTTSQLLYYGLLCITSRVDNVYSVCRLSAHVVLNLHLVHVATHSPVYKLCSSVMLYLQVLESFGIIGYSLLLTVHYMQEGRGGDLVCVLLGCLGGRGRGGNGWGHGVYFWDVWVRRRGDR